MERLRELKREVAAQEQKLKSLQQQQQFNLRQRQLLQQQQSQQQSQQQIQQQCDSNIDNNNNNSNNTANKEFIVSANAEQDAMNALIFMKEKELALALMKVAELTSQLECLKNNEAMTDCSLNVLHHVQNKSTPVTGPRKIPITVRKVISGNEARVNYITPSSTSSSLSIISKASSSSPSPPLPSSSRIGMNFSCTQSASSLLSPSSFSPSTSPSSSFSHYTDNNIKTSMHIKQSTSFDNSVMRYLLDKKNIRNQFFESSPSSSVSSPPSSFSSLPVVNNMITIMSIPQQQECHCDDDDHGDGHIVETSMAVTSPDAVIVTKATTATISCDACHSQQMINAPKSKLISNLCKMNSEKNKTDNIKVTSSSTSTPTSTTITFAPTNTTTIMTSEAHRRSTSSSIMSRFAPRPYSSRSKSVDSSSFRRPLSKTSNQSRDDISSGGVLPISQSTSMQNDGVLKYISGNGPSPLYNPTSQNYESTDKPKHNSMLYYTSHQESQQQQQQQLNNLTCFQRFLPKSASFQYSVPFVRNNSISSSMSATTPIHMSRSANVTIPETKQLTITTPTISPKLILLSPETISPSADSTTASCNTTTTTTTSNTVTMTMTTKSTTPAISQKPKKPPKPPHLSKEYRSLSLGSSAKYLNNNIATVNDINNNDNAVIDNMNNNYKTAYNNVVDYNTKGHNKNENQPQVSNVYNTQQQHLRKQCSPDKFQNPQQQQYQQQHQQHSYQQQLLQQQQQHLHQQQQPYQQQPQQLSYQQAYPPNDVEEIFKIGGVKELTRMFSCESNTTKISTPVTLTAVSACRTVTASSDNGIVIANNLVGVPVTGVTADETKCELNGFGASIRSPSTTSVILSTTTSSSSFSTTSPITFKRITPPLTTTTSSSSPGHDSIQLPFSVLTRLSPTLISKQINSSLSSSSSSSSTPITTASLLSSSSPSTSSPLYNRRPFLPGVSTSLPSPSSFSMSSHSQSITTMATSLSSDISNLSVTSSSLSLSISSSPSLSTTISSSSLTTTSSSQPQTNSLDISANAVNSALSILMSSTQHPSAHHHPSSSSSSSLPSFHHTSASRPTRLFGYSSTCTRPKFSLTSSSFANQDSMNSSLSSDTDDDQIKTTTMPTTLKKYSTLPSSFTTASVSAPTIYSLFSPPPKTKLSIFVTSSTSSTTITTPTTSHTDHKQMSTTMKLKHGVHLPPLSYITLSSDLSMDSNLESDKDEGVTTMTKKKKSKRRVTIDPNFTFMNVVAEGELETIKSIIPLVSDPNKSNDNGMTVLHGAVCGIQVEIVRFLLEYGCNVNAVNNDNWTPLHYAALNSRKDLVELLLQHGACVFALTSDHQTPYDKCQPNDECSKILKDHGYQLGYFNDGVVYCTVDYQAEHGDELTLRDGEMLKILRRGDDVESEWWWATRMDAGSTVTETNAMNDITHIDDNDDHSGENFTDVTDHDNDCKVLSSNGDGVSGATYGQGLVRSDLSRDGHMGMKIEGYVPRSIIALHKKMPRKWIS